MWKWGKTVYIVADWWDIKKNYSKSWNICKVRDGSKWEIAKWYPLETLVAFNEKMEIIPLIWKLFTRKRWYKSDNNEYFNLIKFVERCMSKAINVCYIFDRWYDKRELFEYISRIKRKFIAAIKNTRYVKVKWKTVWVWNAIYRLKGTKSEVEIPTKWWKTIRGKIYYWMVKFPKNLKRNYYLVIVKNNRGKQIFLKNIKITNKEKAIDLLERYNKRWLVEETYKYIKQEYNLESINLRESMERMNNYYNVLLVSIWMWMLWIEGIDEELKDLIIKERSKEYADYKIKNIIYAWLEIMEYAFKNIKLYQNDWKESSIYRDRYRRKWHLYQQNSLFALN